MKLHNNWVNISIIYSFDFDGIDFKMLNEFEIYAQSVKLIQYNWPVNSIIIKYKIRWQWCLDGLNVLQSLVFNIGKKTKQKKLKTQLIIF